MTQIFISHASRDDPLVTALSDWLNGAGFKDHFVDHLHIPGGADWNQALPRQLSSADILVLFVTKDWLASTECFSEYRSHYYAARPVVPLLITPTLKGLSEVEETRFSTLCSSVQGIPFSDVPPNALTEQLVRGSLNLATKTLQKMKRGKIIRLGSFFGVLMLLILMGLAVKFRNEVEAVVDRVLIARAFEPLSTEALSGLTQGKEASSEPDVFIECKNDSFCPEMIVLPPGSFRMGSTPGNVWPEFSEGPPQDVTVVEAFAVSVTEITQEQWLNCFISTRLVEGPSCKEVPNWSGQSKFPVDSISWRDARIYVAWLNQQVVGSHEGPYRLLSEAEWEYAARGVTELSQEHTMYSWGNTLEPSVCSYANALNNEMPENFDIERQGVNCSNEEYNPEAKSPVRSFEPNAFGLYDTAGNVAEWVEDCWHDNHDGRPADSSAWTSGAGPSCDRVIKGGSWFGKPDNLRPAARLGLNSELFGFNIGFRVARDLDWQPNQ